MADVLHGRDLRPPCGVSGRSEHDVERVERGMLINMAHDRFFTQVHESPTALLLKPDMK